MAGYFEQYGIADERRSRVIRWLVISVLSAVVLTIVGYFVLRTYPAKRQVGVFLSDLKRHDYQAAYRDWGCGSRELCPDYTFQNFMRDWGPQSAFADAGRAEIRKTRFCHEGVIVTLAPAKGSDVALWYQRDSRSLGFAPWPVCAERIPAPEGATARP
ncbi:MAG: hypothetical protein ACM336_06150 [Acidobacteriota bacterium]